MTRTLGADLAQVASLGEDVRLACAAAGLSEEVAIDLELALAEAANNIVIHGYAGDGTKSYEVGFETAPAMVRVTLLDRGNPIPAMNLAAADAADGAECGRGMAIIRALVDEIDYASDASGNTLVLTRRG